jgi:hypothetical protein
MWIVDHVVKPNGPFKQGITGHTSIQLRQGRSDVTLMMIVPPRLFIALDERIAQGHS